MASPEKVHESAHGPAEHQPAEHPRRPGIVVGVDGSTCSTRALAWAARQAELVGAPLDAVCCWATPNTYGWAVPLPDATLLETEARAILDKAVTEVLGDDPSLEVRRTVVAGQPSTVLAEMSRGAELVVVGSRGHGGFVGMLLGSVGEHLAAHAHCPLVVIRPEAAEHLAA